MKQIITIIAIMIISITGYSQINVHNVVPSWAVPYFQANIRIKDTIQTKTLLAIDGAFIGNVSITDTATMEHLTVTDSITLEDALFDIYHLAPDADSLVVADDGIINLRTGAYGELRVWVFNAGMYAEYAVVILNVDGSIGIMTENSANVTNVGGTDGKLNIYDAGAYTTIENKLGGNRTIKYTFIH